MKHYEQLLGAAKANDISTIIEILEPLSSKARRELLSKLDNNNYSVLRAAIVNGCYEATSLLLNYGADPNLIRGGTTTNAFHAIASDENDRTHLIPLFINRCDLDAQYESLTPLMFATQFARFQIAAALITAGAQVDLETPQEGLVKDESTQLSMTCLERRLYEKNIVAAKFLVDRGANVNRVDQNLIPTIIKFVAQGNLIAVRFIVENGGLVNVVDSTGLTPLHIAADCTDTAITKYLVEHGANLEARNNDGLTPITCAALEGQNKQIICLKNLGAKVEPDGVEQISNATNPLIAAFTRQRYATVSLLLTLGANVNRVSTHASTFTALAYAVACDRVELTRAIAPKVEDPNAINRALKPSEQYTPLEIALGLTTISIEIVEILLALPNIDLTKVSLLEMAAASRNDVIERVLNACDERDVALSQSDLLSAINACAKQSNLIGLQLLVPFYLDVPTEALFHAARAGSVECVNFLLEAGSDPECILIEDTKQTNMNALHVAALNGHHQVVDVLLATDMDADINPERNSEFVVASALSLAAGRQHARVVKSLLEHRVSLYGSVALDLETTYYVLSRVLEILSSLKSPFNEAYSWLREIIGLVYFTDRTWFQEKKVSVDLFKANNFSQTQFIHICLNTFCELLADGLILQSKDNCFVITDPKLEHADELKIVHSVFNETFRAEQKKKNRPVKSKFDLRKSELVITIVPGELQAAVNMFREINLWSRYCHRRKSKKIKQIKQTVDVVCSALLSSKDLKRGDMEALLVLMKKIACDAVITSEPIIDQRNTFEVSIDFSSQFSPNENVVVLTNGRSRARFTTDKIQNDLCGRLKSFSKSVQFDVDSKKLTVIFNGTSTIQKSDWDSRFFRWFQKEFSARVEEVKAQSAPQVSTMPVASEPSSPTSDSTATNSEISAVASLRHFFERVFAQPLPELSMNWCREFTFADRKSSSVFRFTRLKGQDSLSILKYLIQVDDFLQQFVDVIDDPQCCRFHQDQEPLWVIRRDVLLNPDQKLLDQLRTHITTWLEIVGVPSSPSDETRLLTPATTPSSSPKTRVVEKRSDHWLIRSLLCDSVSQDRIAHFLDHLKRCVDSIRTALNKRDEVMLGNYYRSYVFYFLGLANLLYRHNRDERVKNLRHALRHHSFELNFDEIFNKTYFLVAHVELVLAFISINATIDYVTQQRFDETERYLEMLSQERPLKANDFYQIRIQAEFLYLQMLSSQLSAGGDVVASFALTACQVYKCIKHTQQFNLFDKKLHDSLQSLSQFVGHQYGRSSSDDETLKAKCLQLCDDINEYQRKTAKSDRLPQDLRLLMWTAPGSQQDVPRLSPIATPSN